jgi:imidazole glycerol-phosphate synthase subunit HisH
MISIINYDMGNIGSIANMLKKIGVAANIVNTPEEIAEADKLILPGVGAFDSGMTNLANAGFIEVLQEKVQSGTPILGVCLGMQLMSMQSEEGILPGLGWINAQTIKFSLEDKQLKIPHMGWNEVIANKTDHYLFRGLEELPRYYFVHTYHVVPRSSDIIVANTHYGIPFMAAFQRGHVMGVQFHPEKSHKFGMELFRRFNEYKPD